jgi:hypothetical protein
LLRCYWRHALRKRGLDFLALAAGDLSADPELIEPPAHALPEPGACAVLSEVVFLE